MKTMLYVAGGLAVTSLLIGFNVFNLKNIIKLWAVKVGVQKAGQKIKDKVQDVVDRVKGEKDEEPRPTMRHSTSGI